jgi:DNA repair protein RecO (recombination protein O)
MPARVSESFTLRTYPYREADLIVSFLTRDHGRLRGIARHARRPKSNFGSGLERLSRVNMFYSQREAVELVRIDSCELLHSAFGLTGDYACSVAMDYLVEISEHLLPPAEPNEKYFRLLAAVVAALETSGAAGVWQAVTYFTLWSVRLAGFLGELKVTEESAAIAREMLVTPISSLSGREWSKATAADLRRQLAHRIEEHVERRLITAAYLENL